MQNSSEQYYLTRLKSEFEKRKRINPMYSMRSFAMLLRLNPGTLSSILLGKRSIPKNKIGEIAECLKLIGDEKTLFISSVKSFKNSSSDEDFSLKEYVLKEDMHSQVISQWEYYGVLSLMNTSDFKSDELWIAKRLQIDPSKVKDVLEHMLELNIISKKNEKYTRSHKRLKTTRDIPSQALKHGHKENLELAKKKIDEIDVEFRGFYNETFAINLEKLNEAKKMIVEFKKKLAKFLESGKKSEVYSLNIQLFPYSELKN